MLLVINNNTTFYISFSVFNWLMIEFTTMVHKCTDFVVSETTRVHEPGQRSVKDVNQKKWWFRFCNRRNLNANSSIFICKTHFEKRFMKLNAQQPPLINKMNHVPTIHSACVSDKKSHVFQVVPKHVNLIGNEYCSETNLDRIKHLSQLKVLKKLTNHCWNFRILIIGVFYTTNTMFVTKQWSKNCQNYKLHSGFV